jgi:hypothetical protein
MANIPDGLVELFGYRKADAYFRIEYQFGVAPVGKGFDQSANCARGDTVMQNLATKRNAHGFVQI